MIDEMYMYTHAGVYVPKRNAMWTRPTDGSGCELLVFVTTLRTVEALMVTRSGPFRVLHGHAQEFHARVVDTH